MEQFSKNIKKIGIFTSGGDAPGMNAALRATARVAMGKNLEVIGIINGYQGMIDSNFQTFSASDMGNIIQRGGTIIKTGRCAQFLEQKFRITAGENISKVGIDALVAIGGDGTMRGGVDFWRDCKIPMVGIPATIDNDIFGTDYTIGFDTAVNTALEAIDKIRDTAFSHDRLFIVEVMGHETGHIATEVGLACGAEEIFIPENPATVDDAIQHIKKSLARGKASSILVTAEGKKPGRAYDLADAIRKKAGYEAKVCILGHIQRGGSPTARDRILASRMGAASVETLLKGICSVMTGIQNNSVVLVPFTDIISKNKKLDMSLVKLAQTLSI